MRTEEKTDNKYVKHNSCFDHFSNAHNLQKKTNNSEKSHICSFIVFQWVCYLKTQIFDVNNIIFFLQNWGDYTDMSQAVVIYVAYASDVVLICWFGTQLTKHVRQNGLLLLLLRFITFCVHNFYGALN
jgi:hypothetical protein